MIWPELSVPPHPLPPRPPAKNKLGPTKIPVFTISTPSRWGSHTPCSGQTSCAATHTIRRLFSVLVSLPPSALPCPDLGRLCGHSQSLYGGGCSSLFCLLNVCGRLLFAPVRRPRQLGLPRFTSLVSYYAETRIARRSQQHNLVSFASSLLSLLDFPPSHFHPMRATHLFKACASTAQDTMIENCSKPARGSAQPLISWRHDIAGYLLGLSNVLPCHYFSIPHSQGLMMPEVWLLSG